MSKSSIDLNAIMTPKLILHPEEGKYTQMTSLEQEWNPPPADFKLLEREVHVWQISLQQPESTIHYLEKILVKDEVMGAERFVFDKDRNHFIVARGFLRILLGRYLGKKPNQLQFSCNAYGKPFLLQPSQKTILQFNLSHSHNLALYAFTYVGRVGIDVEYMRSDIEYEQLAKHYFSSAENSALQALPPTAKQQAFYNCWTRKEAYIKARGIGLSFPLALFDVSLNPSEPAALLDSREDSQETTRWSLQTLNPSPGYAATLTVEGNGWFLCCWEWSET